MEAMPIHRPVSQLTSSSRIVRANTVLTVTLRYDALRKAFSD